MPLWGNADVTHALSPCGRGRRAVGDSEPGEGSTTLKPHHRSIGKVMRGNARRMRHRPTEAETAMWRLLRDRRFEGLKFRRQFPFQKYILDFVCFEPRVVIEVDGSQHFGAMCDQHRAEILQREGFEIIRY